MATIKKFVSPENLAKFKIKVDALLAAKVNKETGKGLSTNDYTTEEKDKLAGLSNYTLPQATTAALGGIKVGAGLAINAETGVLSTTGGGIADSVDWSGVQSKPTTIAGYGITDAASKAELADSIAAIPATDLTPYSTTAQMNAAITAAVEAIPETDLTAYAKTADVTTAIATATTDMATQTYVQSVVTGVYHFKGSVANMTALAAITDAAAGDVYNLADTGMNAAWVAPTGTETAGHWDEFGSTVDLSGYVLQSDLVSMTDEEIDALFA